MKISIETESYDPNRYAPPWIAKVSFNGTKPILNYGAWIGQAGDEGVLEIEVNAGDIIARGHSDGINQVESAFKICIVKNDRELIEISENEAYEHWNNESKNKKRPENATYYIDNNYTTYKDIIESFNNDGLRVVLGYGDGFISQSITFSTEDWDMRNESDCNMSEKTWTRRPKNLNECLRLAHLSY